MESRQIGKGRSFMICRRCVHDFPAIYEIINDAARAYEGVIPADCWKTPYMPEEGLFHYERRF